MPGVRPRCGGRRLSAQRARRKAARAHCRGRVRRISARPPARQRGADSSNGDAAPRRGVQQSRRARARRRARHRQRADRMPAGRGAPQRWAQGVPLLRTMPLDASADGWTRHRLVDRGNRLLAEDRGSAAITGGATSRQPADDGPRRRLRLELPHAAQGRRGAGRALPRRRRRQGAFRGRPGPEHPGRGRPCSRVDEMGHGVV